MIVAASLEDLALSNRSLGEPLKYINTHPVCLKSLNLIYFVKIRLSELFLEEFLVKMFKFLVKIYKL